MKHDGWDSLKRGNYKKAIQRFKNRRTEDSSRGLFMCYCALKDVINVEKWIKYHGFSLMDPVCYYFYGVMLYENDEYDASMKCINVAIKGKITLAHVTKSKILMSRLKFDDALIETEKAIEMENNPICWMAKAEVLACMGRYAEASECLQRCK